MVIKGDKQKVMSRVLFSRIREVMEISGDSFCILTCIVWHRVCNLEL